MGILFTKEQTDLADKVRQAGREGKLLVIELDGTKRPYRNGLELPVTSSTDHVCIVNGSVMVEAMPPIYPTVYPKDYKSTFHNFEIIE